MFKKLSFAIILFFSFPHICKAQEKPIWKNSAFKVYRDSIVQGKFSSKAISNTEITSNYESPVYLAKSPAVTFKFSINGKDNEMKPGVDHHINCISSNTETPIIVFGKQFTDTTSFSADQFLQLNSTLHLKVDMRAVFEAFKKDGFYTLYNGDKLYQSDFKGLYVAGATEPLMWDFDNLFQRDQLHLTDNDSDGIYETTITLNAAKINNDLAASWKLSRDISSFPIYESDYTMSNALYNMAIEEMINAIEPDSTFRTGKEWAGVWTRDISYSIILSMAYLQPRVAMKSLLRKVKNGKTIQDTGTGGAYPVSSDRMIWAVAAWELYNATGDKDWLQQAYQIIKKSIDDDIENVYDETTGMVKGESSFLDWREQTYPKWMQPADIYESENLGTNAIHYQANIVLSEMALLLNQTDVAIKHKAIATKIKNGINQYLWMPSKGFYGQYLYGRIYKTLSPKSEALGEALSVLFDIPTPAMQNAIIAKTPVTNFGIPCIYPQISEIPAYHNNAVWPFVESFWAQASAKTGNEKSLLQSIVSIYRPAALFLTNKENFVADNGDYKGTQINSSNMLWSLAGNISLIHKIFFGIQFKKDGLQFIPHVPKAFEGKRNLKNFTYRKSILNIWMEGYGNKIDSIWLDGNLLTAGFIPSNLIGVHDIKIILSNNEISGYINEVENSYAPPTPSLTFKNKTISIQNKEDGSNYFIKRNGRDVPLNDNGNIEINANEYAAYQCIAINKKGQQSFASEPLAIFPSLFLNQYEIENYAENLHSNKGYSGTGYIEISKTINRSFSIPINIETDGVYAIDFMYANGSGPINTENKCAMRTIKEGNKKLGIIVFPQRGNEEWSNWGYSNTATTYLDKGIHNITISYEPSNENMNVDINKAMIDFMRVIKLK